jgi:hypothetical protein
MTEIRVDFLLGPDLSSRFIAWYGQGYGGYSHCAGVLSDERYLDARSDVLSGTWEHGPYVDHSGIVPAGVHIRDPGWEKSIKRTRATIEVSQAQYDSWEANLRAKIGTPYARGDILAFITGRQIDVHGQWECSMLQINALQHIQLFPFPLSVPAHQITPNTLLLMLQAIGATLTDVQKDYA